MSVIPLSSLLLQLRSVIGGRPTREPLAEPPQMVSKVIMGEN